MFFGGVSCHIFFFGYLYVSGSGPVTSVGEEIANLSAIVYFKIIIWKAQGGPQ